MTDSAFRTEATRGARRILRQAWADLLSVYYANTPVWRWLKSGGLVLFGLAVWSGANVLYSYVPEWEGLTYVMAYGFLVIIWGLLTHFLVVRESSDFDEPPTGGSNAPSPETGPNSTSRCSSWLW
jgi:hypothetical protein